MRYDMLLKRIGNPKSIWADDVIMPRLILPWQKSLFACETTSSAKPGREPRCIA